MSVITTISVGTFCWPELCTDEAPASKRFYAALFGWRAEDLSMPEGVYTIFKLADQAVGAMYQMAEARKKAGVRPHWNSYVAVADAQETARKASDLGGKVLSQPFQSDEGWMGNLEDPTGVKFSIWQPKQHFPVRLNETGALCWTELYTHDTDRDAAFYSGLFGWRPQSLQDPMPYTVFNLADEQRGVGGMMEITSEIKLEPQWLPYFQVDDADRTAWRAPDVGGKITEQPMDLPGVGRIALLADSQGAPLAIIQPAKSKEGK